jgi:hypothetical protein
MLMRIYSSSYLLSEPLPLLWGSILITWSPKLMTMPLISSGVELVILKNTVPWNVFWPKPANEKHNMVMSSVSDFIFYIVEGDHLLLFTNGCFLFNWFFGCGYRRIILLVGSVYSIVVIGICIAIPVTWWYAEVHIRHL